MKDEKTKSAVIREIEVIGEATKNIPAMIRKISMDLPWQDMAKMRDKIIHSYFGVDYEIIWKVVKERLPDIKNLIKKVTTQPILQTTKYDLLQMVEMTYIDTPTRFSLVFS